MSLLLLCALPALSTVLLGSDGKAAAAEVSDTTNERGAPALFSWGDVDGDGRLDIAAVNVDGTLQLLASTGDGRFEDVTKRVGLSGIENAALALWADYDADGRLDLFVGAREGASRLFRNEGGVFVDMTEGAGLATEGEVRSADWLDHDGDGRADLHVVTAERHELYRGVEGGFFERADLPLVGASSAGGPVVVAEVVLPTTSVPDPSSDEDGSHGGATLLRIVDGTRSSRDRIPLGPSPSFGSATPIVVFPAGCASSIQDQSSPGTCLGASTTPALGKLYPLSTNLFVAVSGEVGIGTTSPVARLHVAGTARVTDTLTLNPSGDQALDVSTGSIYKGGALFIHTKGGTDDTAVGQDALASVTSGSRNTASGYAALRYNTTGDNNTACGAHALLINTTGTSNTASGVFALRSNTTGVGNTASGAYALLNNTTGSVNTANGILALRNNTFGVLNTASGAYALQTNTSGVLNTANGAAALRSNTIGSANTACGVDTLTNTNTGSNNTATGLGALGVNTTGNSNTASGWFALHNNTTGGYNTALGVSAGANLTTGSNNIAIGNSGVAAESATIRIGTAGTQTRAFIAGIRGVTTGVADAIPVLVDSTGQLGTISSSRRFKKDIADMGDRTERLLELRPVVFRYKQEQQLPDGSAVPLEYGLIAEEVAEVFPELVVTDENGQPFTVKYHLLSSMLLNEMKKLQSEVERLRGLEGRLAVLESRTPATLTADTR